MPANYFLVVHGHAQRGLAWNVTCETTSYKEMRSAARLPELCRRLKMWTEVYPIVYTMVSPTTDDDAVEIHYESAER